MTDVAEDPSLSSPFEAMAPTYERWADPLTTAYAASALDRMGLVRGARVLDVGAGAGGPAVIAAARGCEVVALDNSLAQVRRLRRRLAPFPGCRAEIRDLHDLGYAPSSFDAAMSIFCVTFFPNALDLLRAMIRVTRPGGFVCLVNWTTEFGGPQFKVLSQALEAMGDHGGLATSPGVSSLLSASEMERLCLDAGCTEVSVEAVEAPCAMPDPVCFLHEFDTWFGRLPAFGRLTPSDKARLQSHIEQAYRGIEVRNDTYVVPAVAHIVIGSVGSA